MNLNINKKITNLKIFSGNNVHVSHFLWNLKFKYFTKINFFLFGLITFLAFLFAFLAANSINNAKGEPFDPKFGPTKVIMLSVAIVLIVFLSILFLIISTSSHTSEEKNSRAMEIILSSVGVKYHWFVKLTTNFIWFISIFIWMIFIGCVATSIAVLIVLHTFTFSGGIIIGWILGFSSNLKYLVEQHIALSFAYLWNEANMAFGYDFFVWMVLLTIAINGIIYSIITLALASFIVNTGESLIIVLIILLFPMLFAIILEATVGKNNLKFIQIFLCYFPLVSIYEVPNILFQTVSSTHIPSVVIWTSFLVNVAYAGIFYYLFSKLFAIGVLNYSTNMKLLRRIFSHKKKLILKKN